MTLPLTLGASFGAAIESEIFPLTLDDDSETEVGSTRALFASSYTAIVPKTEITTVSATRTSRVFFDMSSVMYSHHAAFVPHPDNKTAAI